MSAPPDEPAPVQSLEFPSVDETVEEFRSWLRGFIRKEYGSHVHSDDLLDLEQEGAMAIVHWRRRPSTEAKMKRFRSIDEYYFYAKAIARNAIRDYTLKYNSRFAISLFKLRRVLKTMAADADYVRNPHRQRLGDYMHRLGTEFADRSSYDSDEVAAATIMQRRLDILARMGDPTVTDVERRVILLEIITEYKREHGIKSPYERPALTLVVIDGQPIPVKDRNPIARTPVGRKVCTNHVCAALLEAKTTIIAMGFPYCSMDCLKSWPPAVNRIQREFDTPIAVVLDICMKLFRSRRKSAEIIGISPTTMSKLMGRFARQSCEKQLESTDGDPNLTTEGPELGRPSGLG